MSTLKQAFELFWPREIRRSLVENKIEIFSEEATSALVNFHAGPVAFGDVGFCRGRKTGEPAEKNPRSTVRTSNKLITLEKNPGHIGGGQEP